MRQEETEAHRAQGLPKIMWLGSDGFDHGSVDGFLAGTLMVFPLSLSLSTVPTQGLVLEVWEEEVSSNTKLDSSLMGSGSQPNPRISLDLKAQKTQALRGPSFPRLSV